VPTNQCVGHTSLALDLYYGAGNNSQKGRVESELLFFNPKNDFSKSGE
jgi:hypothetical protein